MSKVKRFLDIQRLLFASRILTKKRKTFSVQESLALHLKMSQLVCHMQKNLKGIFVPHFLYYFALLNK